MCFGKPSNFVKLILVQSLNLFLNIILNVSMLPILKGCIYEMHLEDKTSSYQTCFSISKSIILNFVFQPVAN